jgi:hypothetical protein
MREPDIQLARRARVPVTFDGLSPLAQELLFQLTVGSRVVSRLVWAPLELLGARYATSTALKRGFLLTITEQGLEAISAEAEKAKRVG